MDFLNKQGWPARLLLGALALGSGGCVFLLDTDELQAGAAAGSQGGSSAGGQSGQAGSAQGGSSAGQGGESAGGGSGAGSAGSAGGEPGVPCGLSLECEDGDPCTLDTCTLDGEDCDQVDCVSDEGEGLGVCGREPWQGDGFGQDLAPFSLTTSDGFGKPVVVSVAGGFVVGALVRGKPDDVLLVRVPHNKAQSVSKLLLGPALKDAGADVELRSSPGLVALPGGELMAIFGGSQGGDGGVFAAVLDAASLGVKAVARISGGGYDAPAEEHAPQVFALAEDSGAVLAQWVGPGDGPLTYAGITREGGELKPPSTVNAWVNGGGLRAVAAVAGHGTGWGALVLRNSTVEAWHPKGALKQLAGAPDVTKPAGMSAASLAPGFSVAAYGDGTPQDGGKIYLRLLSCTTEDCDVGTLQGDIGAEQASVGLYPALHASPLDGQPGVVQLVVAKLLYPSYPEGLGYLGLFTVDRFGLMADGQGYRATAAPQVNPRYGLFPGDLSSANVTTPRTTPAVSVERGGRVGLAWVEGESPLRSLRFARYGVGPCSPP